MEDNMRMAAECSWGTGAPLTWPDILYEMVPTFFLAVAGYIMAKLFRDFCTVAIPRRSTAMPTTNVWDDSPSEPVSEDTDMDENNEKFSDGLPSGRSDSANRHDHEAKKLENPDPSDGQFDQPVQAEDLQTPTTADSRTPQQEEESVPSSSSAEMQLQEEGEDEEAAAPQQSEEKQLGSKSWFLLLEEEEAAEKEKEAMEMEAEHELDVGEQVPKVEGLLLQQVPTPRDQQEASDWLEMEELVSYGSQPVILKSDPEVSPAAPLNSSSVPTAETPQHCAPAAAAGGAQKGRQLLRLLQARLDAQEDDTKHSNKMESRADSLQQVQQSEGGWRDYNEEHDQKRSKHWPSFTRGTTRSWQRYPKEWYGKAQSLQQGAAAAAGDRWQPQRQKHSKWEPEHGSWNQKSKHQNDSYRSSRSWEQEEEKKSSSWKSQQSHAAAAGKGWKHGSGWQSSSHRKWEVQEEEGSWKQHRQEKKEKAWKDEKGDRAWQSSRDEKEADNTWSQWGVSQRAECDWTQQSPTGSKEHPEVAATGHEEEEHQWAKRVRQALDFPQPVPAADFGAMTPQVISIDPLLGDSCYTFSQLADFSSLSYDQPLLIGESGCSCRQQLGAIGCFQPSSVQIGDGMLQMSYDQSTAFISPFQSLETPADPLGQRCDRGFGKEEAASSSTLWVGNGSSG